MSTGASMLLESMGDGACQDHGQYLWHCGYLRALKDVVSFMDEIEQQKE